MLTVPANYLKKLNMSKVKFFLFVLVCTSLLSSCGSSSSEDAAVFEIKFENISSNPSFTAQNGSSVVSAFSSLVGLVHTQPNRTFLLNAPDQGRGMADLAENGDPALLTQTLRLDSSVEIIGIANDPSNGTRGILAPGQSFTLILSTFSTSDRLSLVTSFLQGNDIVVSTRPEGIALFNDSGVPLSGEITDQFNYYDIGTEINQPPGIGPEQVLRQGDAPTGQTSAGTRESGLTRILNDGFSYPPISNTIRVTITPLEIGNITPTPTSTATPTLSPEPTLTPEVSQSPSASTSADASPIPSSTIVSLS